MKKSTLLFGLFVALGCCWPGQVWGQLSTMADSCAALIKRMEEFTKQYNLAEMTALQPKMESVCATAFGKNSKEYGDAYAFRGYAYQAMGKYREALQIYLEERDIQRKAGTPAESDDYGNVQSNIAQSAMLVEQYDQAQIHNDSALWIALRVSGDKHLSYGNRLVTKGTIFYKRPNRNLDSAEFYLRQGVAILRGAGSPYHLAGALNTWGMTKKDKGDADEAIALFQEAYEVGVLTFGTKHILPTVFLNNKGATVFETGRYYQSEKILEQSVEMYRTLAFTGNGYYAKAVANLSAAKTLLGKYSEAARWIPEVEKSMRAGLLQGSDYADCLHVLALAPIANGEEYKAIQLLNESTTLMEKSGRTASIHYILDLSNLGIVYQQLGDFEKAVFYYEKALVIAKKTWNKPSHHFALLVLNLAIVYSETGEADKAKSMLEEALSIASNAAPETPVLAGIHFAYGWYHYQGKRYDLARHHIEESRHIMEKTASPEKIDYCRLLGAMAVLEAHTNNPQKAEKLYKKTLHLLEKGGNDQTQKYLETLNDYAQFQAAQGKPENALAFYRMAQAKLFDRIDANFNVLTENGKERFLQRNAPQLDRPKNFARQNAARLPQSAALIYDNELALKGLLLHSAHAVAAAIRASGDTVLLQQYEGWKTVKQVLARQYSLPAEERLVPAPVLDSLARAADRTETELNSRSAAFRTARLRVSWKQVRDRLREGEAAVEFIFFKENKANGEPGDSTRYAALVLRPGDQAPRFVPLFEEKNLVRALRRGKMRADEYVDDVYRGLALYRLIWQPLEASLVGVRIVHCAPAGLLHGIAFAALPCGGDQYLCDRYALQMHGSTRDLMTVQPLLAEGIRSAIVCGGILYDSLSRADTVSADFRKSVAETWRPRSGRGSFLGYLPSTEIERKQVSETFRQHQVSVLELSGYAASEERIRYVFSENRAPQLVHIATHGFYDVPDTASAPQKNTLLPMLASGIALAGAQPARAGIAPPPGRQDGLLYAYEIADLDLTATRLAVLSACETGLGDVRGNEGVYGLQRAFKVAGADCVLMSLWEVDDAATSEFMTTFYRHFFEGKEIREAFGLAQREMRAKHERPYLWAAFVLI